jgi:hypothetical protein
MRGDQSEALAKDRFVELDGEFVELAVLLPRGPAARLEKLASARALTLGQLVRLVLRDYLASQAAGAAQDILSSRPHSSPRH